MQELNICEILQKREDLQSQFEAEARMLQQQYESELRQYRPAYKELQETIGTFNEKWDFIMAPYRKEMKRLKQKYNRLAKEL